MEKTVRGVTLFVAEFMQSSLCHAPERQPDRVFSERERSNGSAAYAGSESIRSPRR